MLPRRAAIGLLLAVAAFVSAAKAQFMVETKGKYYHSMSCPLLRDIKLDDLQFARTVQAAALLRKQPCPFCKPPVMGKTPAAVVLQPLADVVVDTQSRVYHRPDCALVKEIASGRSARVDNAAALREAGCRPCPKCQPKPPGEADSASPAVRPEAHEGEDAQAVPERYVSANLEFNEDVVVPGNQPFVNTGIRVAKGQIALIKASGRIVVTPRTEAGQPPAMYGPEGTTEDGRQMYCLVARVGDEVHVIGQSRGVRFRESGPLLLGFVDKPEGYADNQGAFQARISLLTPQGEVKRSPAAGKPEAPRNDEAWWKAFRGPDSAPKGAGP